MDKEDKVTSEFEVIELGKVSEETQGPDGILYEDEVRSQPA